jgi:hypothetical protein
MHGKVDGNGHSIQKIVQFEVCLFDKVFLKG